MNTPNLISYQTLWRVCYTPKGVELMSKYRVVHRCTDYCTPSCIQRAITTLKTFFLQQQPLRKQIVWGSQPIVSCLEKLFQDFRQCSSALYLQERFCSFVCCFRSLSPPSPAHWFEWGDTVHQIIAMSYTFPSDSTLINLNTKRSF